MEQKQNKAKISVKYVALYIRTSTRHQATGLESQERQLKNYCKSNGITNYKVFSDFNYSGKLDSRPALDELMSDVRENLISQVITPNLSRVSRSLKSLLITLDELQSAGVDFLSLSESFSINSMHGRLMISIIGAVDELSRQISAEKVRIGLENCRAKGIRLGRQRVIDRDAVQNLHEKKLSMREIAKVLKISPSSVCRILQAINKKSAK